MAVKLPDGSTVSLATTMAAAKSYTAITNAKPAVVTAATHGLVDHDVLVMTSNWSNLNDRVCRVAGSTADSFNLEGIDTTSTQRYPAGGGAGSFTKIQTWTTVSQIMGLTTSGGEQQFTNYSFLEQDHENQIPTTISAMSLTLDIADDPTLEGYIALKEAAEARATRALRFAMPDGSFIYMNGVVSFNEVPTVSKGQLMQVKASFAIRGRPTRYAG